jgi:hypothetical protein
MMASATLGLGQQEGQHQMCPHPELCTSRQTSLDVVLLATENELTWVGTRSVGLVKLPGIKWSLKLQLS